MDEYYRILDSLPPALRTPLGRLDARCAPHIQEIRLRLGQPIQFTIRGRLCPAAKFLPGAGLPAAMEANMLRDCFLPLCRRSVYAYEDELQQGYFTVQGGCRIGVAGCRGPGGFSAVTSLNLRIARWITCPLPPALEEAVAARTGGLLLAGPPGSGKTTLLRSIVQRLCESDSLVSVIDERGELMACETGSLPRAAQIRCDVYARCTKPEGIAMALRCMNPQILVCDELGTAEDAQAVAQGVASGVVFFATVHCDTRRVYIKSPRWPRCWPQAPLQKPPFCPGVPTPAPWHNGSHFDCSAACCGRHASALCRHGLWLYGGSPYPGLPAAAAQPVPVVRLSGRAAQRTGPCRPGAFAPRSALPGICRLLPGGCCSSGRPAASILPARGPAVRSPADPSHR